MTTALGLDPWPTLCPVGATDEEREIRAAMARLRRAEDAVRARRADVAAAIKHAIESRAMKQAQVARVTGYTREHIRRITSRSDDIDPGHAADA